ncbi:MAG: NAD-dependent epimerase/dehydratase family protein [Candidatus Helarchaeota archaeon]
MKLSDKKILVTGGAGFIGSHLIKSLVDMSNEIIVLDNFSSGSLDNLNDIDNDKLEIIKGDIRNINDLKVACKDAEMVFHYAADPNVRDSVKDPINSFKINVVGTLNILEIMRKNDIQEIVFASSGGTLYGEVEDDLIPTHEEVQFRPISPYGASKAAIESYLSAYTMSYGLIATSVRFANIYGPKSTHGVMYDFYQKLKQNPNELIILGNGKQEKSYMYVSDCIEATLIAVRNTHKGFKSFNLGVENTNTVNEIAEFIINEMNLTNVKLNYTGGDRGWIGDVKFSLLSIDKIKKLGWKPKVSLKEGIHYYIQWLNNLK